VTAVARRQLVLRVRRPELSLRLGVGTLLVLGLCAAAILALLAVGVGSGDYPLTMPQLVEALLGGGDERARYVVWQLRLPRLIVAVLAGVSLALSGLVFQAMTRNALVSPDIIGVTSGAAAGAVAVLITGLPVVLMGPAACAGGLLAGLLLYVLAMRGVVQGRHLVLVGIGLAAIMEAVIGYLITRGSLIEVQQATVWLVGSLYAASWSDVALLGAGLLVLGPLLLWTGRSMLAMELGDDSASALGVETAATRRRLMLIAVLLASLAVAAVGPIGFVAFLAPNLGRRLARTSGAGKVAAAAVMGALLILAADIIARRIAEPAELPVGIVTILLGGPYFLWLLARGDRVGAPA
jgi:iron complex transport system permease protein